MFLASMWVRLRMQVALTAGEHGTGALLGGLLVAVFLAPALSNAQAGPDKSKMDIAAKNVNRTIGVCQLIENPVAKDGSAVNSLSPIVAVQIYFNSFENVRVEGPSQVSLLRPPVHGKLEDLGTVVFDEKGHAVRESGQRSYYYRAKAGYLGKDSATLLVEISGFKVKTVVSFHVLAGPLVGDTSTLYNELCPNIVRKISAVE
jgi:hypothetical protein